ncbi:MAG TPA: ImmA/IrrE family metallo-endopeptidase, partial [Thermoplasmata archaeon]|nr:ImmA/IrrE family metallo-endopeptidase [Thermoplasmata archaeon]
MDKKRGSFRVEVKPEVISWAVSSSGWQVSDISEHLGVESASVRAWMSGKATPSLRQLERLAELIKRPLAVFFLPKPPREAPLPKDYRVSPERRGEFDRETLLAVRKTRRLQRLSRELLENQNKGVRPEIGAYSVTDDSHELGNRFRDEFGITDQVQKKWRDPYDAFNTLRGLIESRNIFVFQMHMPINDARGFVLVDELPAVIVVNSADQIEARVFTLVHELGHVLLRKTGINTPEAGLGRGRIDEVERWCNGFAAEFLVPGKLAKGEFSQHEDTLLEDETLRRISKSLKVSKSMLLVRMKDSGFIEHRELQSAL